MREQEAKRPPFAGDGTTGSPTKHEEVGSRQHRTREAVRKDQESIDAVMQPGPPPAPGIEEDYAKRSGKVPLDESKDSKKRGQPG